MYVLCVTAPPTRPTLRDLRKALGLTQEALASAAGMARATVNRLEQGKPESVEFDTVRRLAEALSASTLVVYAALEASKNASATDD